MMLQPALNTKEKSSKRSLSDTETVLNTTSLTPEFNGSINDQLNKKTLNEVVEKSMHLQKEGSPHRHVLTTVTQSETNEATSPTTDKSDSNKFSSTEDDEKLQTGNDASKTDLDNNSSIVKNQCDFKKKTHAIAKSKKKVLKKRKDLDKSRISTVQKEDEYFDKNIRYQAQPLSETTPSISTVQKLSFLPLILFSGMTLALGGLGMHLLMSKSEVPIIKLSPQGNIPNLFPIEVVLFVGLIAALAVACYLFHEKCETKIDGPRVETFGITLVGL